MLQLRFQSVRTLAVSGIIALATVLFLGCQAPGSGVGGAVTAAQADVASQTVEGAINIAVGNVVYSTTTDINYSTSGLDVSGSVTSTSAYPRTYTLTLTLDHYTDAATGYTVSGTVQTSLTFSSFYSINSGSVTGNLSFSGGPIETISYDIIDISDYTFTGTITCNGTVYDVGDLSVESTFEAFIGVSAVSYGIRNALKEYSTWRPSSGTAVSYTGTAASGTENMSMTGTLGGTLGVYPESYYLTINFSNYSDVNASVYEVNDTANVEMTVDNATNMSGTITGTQTLLGGHLSSVTWNNVSFTGPETNPLHTVTGTITVDGRTYDAKVFF